MRTFSIYRGQSRTGIGEGPGNPPVPHGEQYLAADGPLAADGKLLTAARPWMTPDWRVSDEQELGDRIEAWSYLRHGPLCLVVRLAAAAVYDRRTAYFAHGRAFLAQDCIGDCDPGAYLGCSEAFEKPWRDGQRPAFKAPPPPEVVRPEQVQQERGVACALLAHLYQGIVSGYPIVLAVPVTEFQIGSPLHALVSFARAALPRELKLDCRIRVFTRLPELFLRHLRADLIVIPEKEAGDALTARRDATLLDRKGVRREGRELARQAAEYAEAVVRRFSAFHGGGLLAFSDAISEHLPKDRLPSEQEIARVSALYNFAVARTEPSRLGEWLKSSLLKNLDERPTGLPWGQLIGLEDWRALAFDDLAAILLTEVSGEEAQRLVRRAEAEARRPERREQISEERLRSHLPELPSERRAELLARLLDSTEGRPLVAAEVAARLSASLPTAELTASRRAAPMLAAELALDLLGRRASDAAALASAAAQEPEVTGILTLATSAGSLAPDWALRLLSEASEPVVIRAAAEILPATMLSPHWQPVIQPLFDRLLAVSAFPLTDLLQEPLTKALHQAHSAELACGFHDRLILTELLVRCAAPAAGTAVQEAWSAAEKLSDAGDRSDFIGKVSDPAWRSLQPDQLVSPAGQFRPAWARSFADRLLESEAVRDRLSVTALLKLAGEHPEIGPWLDPRMRSDPGSATAELLAAGRWSLWRSRSRLDEAGRQVASLAWLASGVWSQAPAPQARLEDWKQVMWDLRELRADELRSLFASSPPRPLWPWITPFQDEQLQDLCRAARSDPGILAQLAENLDAARDLGYPLNGTIFEHVLALAQVPDGHELPGNALAYLSESPPPTALSPQHAARLYARTRHRKERAAVAVLQSVAAHIARDPPAALRAAEPLSPWDGRLLAIIQDWQVEHPQEAREGEIGEILRRALPGAKRAAPSGLRPQLHPAVQALLQGEGGNRCWQELGRKMTAYARDAAGSHPVDPIVTGLRDVYPLLDGGERAALETLGWETFAGVARAVCTILRQPQQRDSPLPAFELASLMLPHLGPGLVALRLLHLAGPFLYEPEWWSSLLAGLTCRCHNDGLRNPGDRLEAALGRVFQGIPGLFADSESAKPALSALEARMKRLSLRHGPPSSMNLEPRQRAGAAS